MAVAAGLNLWCSIFTAVICSVLSVTLKSKIYSPSVFLALPVMYVAFSASPAAVPFSVILGALFYLALSRFKNKLNITAEMKACLALALALTATVLLTTQYFGIGATGTTAFEMLQSYRSRGFHPNWRGVFYGTITLFAMITYPVKFKRLKNYLPVEIFSLAIPFILNLILNPIAESSPIDEVGSLSYFASGFSLETVFPFMGLSADTPLNFLTISLLGAVCTALLLFIYSYESPGKSESFALVNAVSGISGFSVKEYPIKHYSVGAAIAAVITLSAVYLLCPALVSRIPVHSLSVILIVSAWMSVPYKSLANTFTKGKAPEITALIVMLASFLVLSLPVAMLISALFIFIIGRARRER